MKFAAQPIAKRLTEKVDFGVGQVIEITNPGYWLGKSHGFLEVRHKGENLGRVALDDIATVIISVPGCAISSNLIDHLTRL